MGRGAMLSYARRAAVTASLVVAASVSVAQEPPRLVLQITVDQLRGDMIDRFGSHIGQGGIRYLLKNGVSFKNAHHRHANTETVVGHTTLATGADPAIHGMVANLWFDRKSGMPFYNVQDPDYPLVGAQGVDAANEIDPTQRAATTDGRSPRSILSSTISDEIAMHFGPMSKVFGVSVKDRGAIAMAGHAGQAYWFSKSEGRFVTSTFYRRDYPAWVTEWEALGKVHSYANQHWDLLQDRDSYAFADRDDQLWETEMPGFGRSFPHPWGPSDGKYYTTLLTLSPAGDEITVDFAKTLLSAEQLGQDSVTDYLSVSLSSTDYVGHIFGPSSLESEDNFAQLDRQIADLLRHVEASVGLDKTLIVLSADHGAPEHPDYLAQYGIKAGLFDFETVNTEPGFARLHSEFGVSRDLIQNFSNPYVYLDQTVIADRGLDPVVVENAVAAELQKLPGIAYAVSSSALRRGSFPNTKISKAVLANFNPDRSGDIYVVFEPHWYVADLDGLTVASAHGSPWTYDTHVPLIFAGPGLSPRTVTRRVETVDVAPTIAVFLGTKQPSGATGLTLPEVKHDANAN
jgi:predicted AlkP superfamily pyrophosphatase or phosphodiesterase